MRNNAGNKGAGGNERTTGEETISYWFELPIDVAEFAVKFLDNQTKATQVSQYELVLHKDRNWKIVG